MAGKRGTKQGVRLTVSIDPAVYREVSPDGSVNKSRLVQEALTLHRRETLRREMEEFCAIPDASDLDDARRALPAQREALDRD